MCDFADKDLFNRPVKYHDLSEVPFKADFIVSSHTLEHIENLDPVLKQLQQALKPKGQLFLNLPGYSCVRWQHGVHTNREYNDHKWSFYLEETPEPKGISRPLAIDRKLSEFFDISEKTYCGDNSILIQASPKKG